MPLPPPLSMTAGFHTQRHKQSGFPTCSLASVYPLFVYASSPSMCDITTLHQSMNGLFPPSASSYPSIFTCRCVPLNTMGTGSWPFSTAVNGLWWQQNHTHTRTVCVTVCVPDPPPSSPSAAWPLIQPLSSCLSVCLSHLSVTHHHHILLLHLLRYSNRMFLSIVWSNVLMHVRRAAWSPRAGRNLLNVTYD